MPTLDVSTIVKTFKDRKYTLACNEAFDIDVEYTVLRTTCDGSPTELEQGAMTKGLQRDLDAKAKTNCDMVSGCNNPEYLGASAISESCTKNNDGKFVWTFKMKVSTRCTQ
jgi:hypothetical protein